MTATIKKLETKAFYCFVALIFIFTTATGLFLLIPETFRILMESLQPGQGPCELDVPTATFFFFCSVGLTIAPLIAYNIIRKC